MLDNGLKVIRERRVFPLNPSAGKIGKRQAAAMALEEFERWNRHGQVLRPGERPMLARTGGMAKGTAPTFSQFFPDYLEFCKSPNAGANGPNSRSTIESKTRIFHVHLLPAFGGLPLDELKRRAVDHYVIEKTRKGRSGCSIRMDLTYLRHLLVVAKSYELIDRLPEFKVPRYRQRDVVALDPDEVARFTATFAKRCLRDVAMLQLMLRTGLRCGEMLGLHPADLDLESSHPTVRVLRTYTKGAFGPPKGRKSRVVPLVPKLASRLDELMAQRGFSPRSTKHYPFSPDYNMQAPLCPSRVQKIVYDVGKAADIQHVHPHAAPHLRDRVCPARGPVADDQRVDGACSALGHSALSPPGGARSSSVGESLG